MDTFQLNATQSNVCACIINCAQDIWPFCVCVNGNGLYKSMERKWKNAHHNSTSSGQVCMYYLLAVHGDVCVDCLRSCRECCLQFG